MRFTGKTTIFFCLSVFIVQQAIAQEEEEIVIETTPTEDKEISAVELFDQRKERAKAKKLERFPKDSANFKRFSEHNRVKLYQSALFDESGLGFEMFVKEFQSYEALLSYTFDIPSFKDNGHSTRISDFVGDNGVKLRITQKNYSPTGFYFGPSVFYNYLTYNDRKTWTPGGFEETTTYYKESAKNHKIGLDFIVGKMLRTKKSPYIELTGGLGHRMVFANKSVMQLNNLESADDPKGEFQNEKYLKHSIGVSAGIKLSF
jgi:hypothetical protein